MAEYVIKKFPNGARIIFLGGEPGSSPAIDQAKGALETLKAAGDKYKVLADQTANFKRDQGMTVTLNLLTSIGTPPDVIICSNAILLEPWRAIPPLIRPGAGTWRRYQRRRQVR